MAATILKESRMGRKLFVALLLAYFSLTSVASGQDERRADDEQTVTAAPERRKVRRAADRQRKERWRRFDDVRFITATPITRRDGAAKAAPSTTVIEYDNNNPVKRSANTSSVVVGNQFNVGGGGNPIGGPWAISGFVVQNAGPAYGSIFTSTATIAFFGGPGTGTTAPLLGVVPFVTLTGGIQAFFITPAVTGTGSFLGGVVNSSLSTTTPGGATIPRCDMTSAPPTTACNGVALDTAQNSTNPLGFHAMSIAAFTSPGTGFNTLGNHNAIFKVLGSSLPVELLKFSVEPE
jgi:hypothetical protein